MVDYIAFSGLIFIIGALAAGASIFRDRLKDIAVEIGMNMGLALLFSIAFINLSALIKFTIAPQYYLDIVIVLFFFITIVHTLFGEPPEQKIRRQGI